MDIYIHVYIGDGKLLGEQSLQCWVLYLFILSEL